MSSDFMQCDSRNASMLVIALIFTAKNNTIIIVWTDHCQSYSHQNHFIIIRVTISFDKSL